MIFNVEEGKERDVNQWANRGKIFCECKMRQEGGRREKLNWMWMWSMVDAVWMLRHASCTGTRAGTNVTGLRVKMHSFITLCL